MKRPWMSAGAFLAVLTLAAGAWAQEPCPSEAAPTYGMAVGWAADMDVASEQARDADRLVLVVHLSGELDDPEKT